MLLRIYDCYLRPLLLLTFFFISLILNLSSILLNEGINWKGQKIIRIWYILLPHVVLKLRAHAQIQGLDSWFRCVFVHVVLTEWPSQTEYRDFTCFLSMFMVSPHSHTGSTRDSDRSNSVQQSPGVYWWRLLWQSGQVPKSVNRRDSGCSDPQAGYWFDPRHRERGRFFYSLWFLWHIVHA